MITNGICDVHRTYYILGILHYITYILFFDHLLDDFVHYSCTELNRIDFIWSLPTLYLLCMDYRRVRSYYIGGKRVRHMLYTYLHILYV